MKQTTRWMGDARLTGLEGDHLAVAITGYFGLATFSLGFLVFIYHLMKTSGDKLMEPHTMRKYGYFYWIALLGLGQAKLVHLGHAVFYTMFMVMTLQKAGGFEYQDMAYGFVVSLSFLSLLLCS